MVVYGGRFQAFLDYFSVLNYFSEISRIFPVSCLFLTYFLLISQLFLASHLFLNHFLFISQLFIRYFPFLNQRSRDAHARDLRTF